MKTVYLTGLSGFTGCYLKEQLEKGGYAVVGARDEVDITNYKQLEQHLNSIDFDYLINLAAITDNSNEGGALTYKVNTVGAVNILQYLDKNRPEIEKIIMVSSSTVYRQIEKAHISEDAPLDPLTHYANSKLSMEYMAKTFKNLPIIITRPFNYTGVGQPDRFLVPKLVNAFKEKVPLLEIGNQNITRSFSDVRYIAEAYSSLLRKGEPNETYNLCSPSVVSIEQILNELSEISDHNLKTVTNPKFIRENDPAVCTGSNEKLAKAVGELQFSDFTKTLKWMYEN